jgi:hypothetical protein
VDHEVDEIKQDPTGLALALAPEEAAALLAAGALDLVSDRAYLAIVRSRADDEIVADDQRLRDVQNDNVASLLG